MKYTVHVTLVAAVEIDAASESEAIELALSNVGVHGANQFDESGIVFESYTDDIRKVRRGIGSH